MFNRYYQEQLSLLKDLGVEFSKAHPALAPMLSGQTPDPDVERLLEGTAFLTGMVRQKLDDEFPEILHGLMGLIFPHYLRPLPSASILVFTPKPTLKEPLLLPAGVEAASMEIDGTACRFRTCYDIEAAPLRVVDAAYIPPTGGKPAIRVTFELTGMKLSEFKAERIRLYLAGAFPQASDLYRILCSSLERIILSAPEGGGTEYLPPDTLVPAGFAQNEALLPYPGQTFSGYRIIQEYFTLPEKFLFLDFLGLSSLTRRGTGSRFEVLFELSRVPGNPPAVKRDSFVLFATPVVNIFPHEASPIRLDHKRNKYQIRPEGGEPGHYQVYSVRKVRGFMQGTSREKAYIPFEMFSPQYEAQAVYNVSVQRSPVTDDYDAYISVAYPSESGAPERETLSIDLLCTNGSLPERLQLGDISKPTSTSSELMEFRNVRPPTPNVLPPLGSNLLWRLLSHISINYLTLTRPENLKTLLDLYIFPDGRDRAQILANKKRVAGVEGVEARTGNRMVRGMTMRGEELTLTLRRDNYAGLGDMFLFGAVLNRFLGYYSTINSYTSVTLKEALSGETYTWPARIGDRFLL